MQVALSALDDDRPRVRTILRMPGRFGPGAGQRALGCIGPERPSPQSTRRDHGHFSCTRQVLSHS